MNIYPLLSLAAARWKRERAVPRPTPTVFGGGDRRRGPGFAKSREEAGPRGFSPGNTRAPRFFVDPRPGLPAALVVAAAFLTPAAHAQSLWTHFGGNAAHSPGLSRPGPRPAELAAPTWVFSHDESGAPITFVGQAGVVVSNDLVYALGSTGAGSNIKFRLFAVDRRSAKLVWWAEIERPYLNSFSTPVFDRRRNVISVASGARVLSFDGRTGAAAWVTNLFANVVNASPVVTPDLGFRDRMFITDYDGAEGGGRLYCINVAPRHSVLNPCDPGDIVWTAPMGGSVGNTPAYAHRRVYVASAGDPAFDVPGAVRAYDATKNHASVLWSTDNPDGLGYFGGVCVRDDPERSWVFAASYDFASQFNISSIVKLDARNGDQRWSVPCERTSMTPIPLPDGRLVLAGGVAGYGSAPRLQVFLDRGSNAVRLWDSVIDNEPDLQLGGWTTQPALCGERLFVGLIPSVGFGAPCTHLFSIELPLLGYVADPVSAVYAGAGSTPAAVDGNLYTVGIGGLHAFGPVPPQGDVNQDGWVDSEDIHAFGAHSGRRDVDLNGVVNDQDHALLCGLVRRAETQGAWYGR